ncbi:MAG: hypothetical protein CBD27_03340 [Rhodospirillaceae bacterium TMED167]|nr:hypothetical protein [Rhodospirillaceae bacterium]OUW29242.1 MAG: hypothetical protein CBD27_03340 [Rhodospirillaceae bacterium TMED167]
MYNAEELIVAKENDGFLLQATADYLSHFGCPHKLCRYSAPDCSEFTKLFTDMDDVPPFFGRSKFVCESKRELNGATESLSC